MPDRKGGCLCGAVRYELKTEPRGIAICHCTHCRRLSGSLFSLNVVVREAEYQQSGKTAVFIDRGDSGHPVERHFCGGCGSPILAKTALMPGKVVVKAGTLDSMDAFGRRSKSTPTTPPHGSRRSQALRALRRMCDGRARGNQPAGLRDQAPTKVGSAKTPCMPTTSVRRRSAKLSSASSASVATPRLTICGWLLRRPLAM